MATQSPIWKWLVVIVQFVPILFVVYLVLQTLVIIPYRHKHGYTYTGAMAKFQTSVASGDTSGAMYWAERMVHYSLTGRRSPAVFGGRASASQTPGRLTTPLAVWHSS